MKRNLFIVIFSSLILNAAVQASTEFVFNNKNLNSIASLICLMESSNNSKNVDLVSIHKVSINQKRVGVKAQDVIVEIKGTCNTLVDRINRKVKTLGEEFLVTIDRRKDLVGFGNIGIKKISIKFNRNFVQSLTIEDPLLLTKETRNLSNSSWAKSNQIFSFGSKPIQLNLSRGVAAIETDGDLKYKSAKFFSLWSDQAVGCDLAVSKTECETLSNL